MKFKFIEKQIKNNLTKPSLHTATLKINEGNGYSIRKLKVGQNEFYVSGESCFAGELDTQCMSISSFVVSTTLNEAIDSMKEHLLDCGYLEENGNLTDCEVIETDFWPGIESCHYKVEV